MFNTFYMIEWVCTGAPVCAPMHIMAYVICSSNYAVIRNSVATHSKIAVLQTSNAYLTDIKSANLTNGPFFD